MESMINRISNVADFGSADPFADNTVGGVGSRPGILPSGVEDHP